MRFLLASRSPRRAQILSAAGFDHDYVEPGEEPAISDRDSELQCIDAARAKAAGAEVGGRSGILLAVDTVVSLDGRTLGKPADREQAGSDLRILSGREHEVLTAHAHAKVVDGETGPIEILVARSKVAFRELSAAELETYLDGLDWTDKAGSYGIQSDASTFAWVVEGDLDTVIGLSLVVVRKVLAQHA